MKVLNDSTRTRLLESRRADEDDPYRYAVCVAVVPSAKCCVAGVCRSQSPFLPVPLAAYWLPAPAAEVATPASSSTSTSLSRFAVVRFTSVRAAHLTSSFNQRCTCYVIRRDKK